MPELSMDDIIQQYQNSLIFYKGKPHKVETIGQKITLKDICTQRNKMVEFSIKDFTAPMLRLGYVNIDGAAIYVKRKPVRMYLTGINHTNVVFIDNRGSVCPNSVKGIIAKLTSMSAPELADMFYDHYPSLKEAYKSAIGIDGQMAFDKQFAVDAYKQIFYKGDLVGTYDEKTNLIKFNKDKEYLNLIIGNEYEKAARTFGTQQAA